MSTYRIDRSYDWNYEHGPAFAGQPPKVPNTPHKDYFGIPVRSRIGVAAGLLLNGNWIELYSRLGFDLLTYKTVRSGYRKCQPLPNWIYVDAPEVSTQKVLYRADRRPKNATEVTSAVSFGMPSKSPEVWTADVARARKRLRDGQALIVSVVASPQPGDGERELIEDFARLAGMAREAGAQVIEANLSCPNVCTSEGNVYLDPGLSKKVAQAMRKEAKEVPLTLKAGYYEDKTQLKKFLRAVAGSAEGVVMVNGVSCRVKNRDGTPAFGKGRETVGVLGRGINNSCLANVRSAVGFIEKEKLPLKILAVGGVSSPEDAAAYFDSGAYAVLMGSAPMFDPLLAVRMKREHTEL